MANFFDQFDTTADVPRITVTPRVSVPAAGRALLDTIAGSESPDYNTVYGGGKFDSFDDHPRRLVPITSGPNAGKNSSAAGRYQFLQRTWDEVKREAGLPDFSPESQDAGAWHLADKTYRQKTGRDLTRDLEAAQGNPNAISSIGRALSGVWTSLPGGSEPNSMTSSFAARYAGPSTEVSAQRKPSANFFDQFDPVAPQGDAGVNRPSDGAAPIPADTGGRFIDQPGQSFRTAREGVSETAPPPTSMMTALGRGAASGLTANFFDELVGLAEAGGRKPGSAEPMTIAQILTGAYKRISGDPQAAQLYETGAGRERAETAKVREDRPGASLAGELAGAIAIPVGAAAQGATMGGRALRSAAVGAGFGATAGAGEGEGLADRATRAASGAAIGGAIGGAASPVLDLAARGAGAAIREGGRYMFPSVETRAARMVDNARQSATQIDPGARTRLTPQEFAGTPQAIVADTAGEPGRAIARWAANASPEARETLNAMIDQRFTGQSGRVIGWLNNTFHYPNASAQQEAIEQTARQVNRAAYARAYRDGANGLWSPELERLAGSDAVTAAMQRAIRSARDEGVVSGYGAMNPRITFNQSGVIQFNRGRNGVPTYPDLQYWDLVRRELSDAARAATPGSAEARRLNSFARSLNEELDRLVPSYQQARQGAAHFFGAENALEAGQNFVTSRVSNADARRALAQMSPQERQLFQDGFVSRYIQTLGEVGDRRDVLNTIANSPAARERLNIALGPQRANELEAMLRVEGVMNFLRTQVQGNSTTARQLVELGAVGTYGGVGAYMSDPQTMIQSVIAGAFVARGRSTDQRVARRVAEMLVSHDPQVLQRGLQMVARNRGLMDGIRGLDQRIARLSGSQSSGVPAVQSASIGRAEDQ